MVGGLLMAASAVGTFVAWHRVTAPPQTAYVVAAHPIPPGHVLLPNDLRLVPMNLPQDVAEGAFTDVAAVADRIAVGPVSEGELVQEAALSDGTRGDPLVELSFALPRDRAVDGRLRGGDRVDVFVTEDDRTSLVLESVLVVAATETGHTSVVANGDVMVTVGLDDLDDRGDVIHAVRAGEVTLARTTLAGPERSSGSRARSDQGDS